MTYRVAIVGGGGIAEQHLIALSQLSQAKAVAIADLLAERAQALASQYGGLAAYTDYKEMILREKPDIAIITLPHFLHREAALFCAEAGCHILLEKPMALNVQECDDIIQAAERFNIQLLVGHTQHYIAENRLVKKLIEEGSLGKLVMINDVRNVYYYQDQRPAWFFDKALAGGGIMMNLGSHSIDKISWFTDSPVHKIKAITSHYGTKGDIEGSGMVFLHHENGIPATIAQSGYKGFSRNETELVFTEGMLRLETGIGVWISRGGAYERMETEEQELPFVLQIRDLITSIETKTPPLCTMEYSRHIIAVVQALYLSQQTGQEQLVEEASQ